MSSPFPDESPAGPSRELAPAEPPAVTGIGHGMRNAMLESPYDEAMPESEATPEFDAWLRLHLGGLHAGVLAEPVPQRFLQLLRLLPG